MTPERFARLEYKRGAAMPILGRGNGKVETICKCSTCLTFPKANRFVVLPCGCRHQTLVACTCYEWKDRFCNGCHRTFVQVGREWFEIADPHQLTSFEQLARKPVRG